MPIGPNNVDDLAKRYTILARKLHDAAVFLDVAVPILKENPPTFGSQTKPKFTVPALLGYAEVTRSQEEIDVIYDRGVNRQLFESYLLTAVSQFETFLFHVLTIVLRHDPSKLYSEEPKPWTAAKVDELITKKLVGLSYGPPSKYFTYVNRITGALTEASRFYHYIEIKATRDIIVHNDGIANDTYQKKSGKTSRAKNGDLLKVNKAYLHKALQIIRQCADTVSGAALHSISK